MKEIVRRSQPQSFMVFLSLLCVVLLPGKAVAEDCHILIKKTGRLLTGTLETQDEKSVWIIDSSGARLRFEKQSLDLEKMFELNHGTCTTASKKENNTPSTATSVHEVTITHLPPKPPTLEELAAEIRQIEPKKSITNENIPPSCIPEATSERHYSDISAKLEEAEMELAKLQYQISIERKNHARISDSELNYEKMLQEKVQNYREQLEYGPYAAQKQRAEGEVRDLPRRIELQIEHINELENSGAPITEIFKANGELSEYQKRLDEAILNARKYKELIEYCGRRSEYNPAAPSPAKPVSKPIAQQKDQKDQSEPLVKPKSLGEIAEEARASRKGNTKVYAEKERTVPAGLTEGYTKAQLTADIAHYKAKIDTITTRMENQIADGAPAIMIEPQQKELRELEEKLARYEEYLEYLEKHP